MSRSSGWTQLIQKASRSLSTIWAQGRPVKSNQRVLRKLMVPSGAVVQASWGVQLRTRRGSSDAMCIVAGQLAAYKVKSGYMDGEIVAELLGKGIDLMCGEEF